MKLFIKRGNQKIYIRSSAKTRTELIRQVGGKKFSVNGVRYNVSQVFAEKEGSNTIVAGLVGGSLGLLGGPVGFITGATLGGIIGNSSEKKEEIDVKHFNQSKCL